ncbi:MAG TPA: V-type ATP synthase subunit E family protein [Geobacterales bacterium]|nr:V-type ATP synthase subunit E family protein [Geobacterales bacterium]
MEALKRMIEENSEVTKNKNLAEIDKLTVQINKILEKYIQSTLSKLKEIEEDYSRKIDSMKKMIVSNAEINVRNSLLKLYSEYVDKALNSALEDIGKDRKRYLQSLEKLVSEAIENVGEKKVKIFCNGSDEKEIKKIASKIQKERGIEVEVISKEVSKYGGVIAANSDETVFYNNTVEARLERMKEDIRKVLGDILRD